MFSVIKFSQHYYIVPILLFNYQLGKYLKMSHSIRAISCSEQCSFSLLLFLHGVLSVLFFSFHFTSFYFIHTILKLHVVMLFVQFYPHAFYSAFIPFSSWIVIGFATNCWTLRRICYDYIDAIDRRISPSRFILLSLMCLLLWISIFILKRWFN